MEVKTVEQTPFGYLLNGYINVPSDKDNADYQLIQAWIKSGNTPDPIAMPTLVQVKANKLIDINNKAQQFVDANIPAYPEFSMQTFKSQEEEAIAYLADNTAPTPTLSSIANQRGLNVLEIANRVIAKANAFKALAGDVEGQRQAYEDQLEAAADVAAVEAIVVNYVLPA